MNQLYMLMENLSIPLCYSIGGKFLGYFVVFTYSFGMIAEKRLNDYNCYLVV